MPSKSRKLFRDKLLPDVGLLLDAHKRLNPNGRGRRNLGYITRSGILMLCASWEMYIEEVVKEGIIHLNNQLDDPQALPQRVRGKISQAAKNDKHEHGVLKLTGNGWKQIYLSQATRSVENLNSPKFGQVSVLLNDWLGVSAQNLEDAWRRRKDELNELVTLRGEIAHRGADATYLRVSRLRHYKEAIDDFVVDTDRYLCEHLQNISGKRPWRNTGPRN